MRRFLIPGVLAALALAAGPLTALAAGLEVVPVAEGVYAVVGPLGPRSPKNLGNNATFGAVVTDSGVVLIDPGGSTKGAAAIEAALRTVTDQPVTHVIDTGGQDHRWMGNGYFKARGATIIASIAAVVDQQERARAELKALKSLIGKTALEGTELVHADLVFEDRLDLQVGGVRIEIRHHGTAHTPGDSFVWLPDRSVMFTGDIVYLERLLSVLDVSNSRAWVGAFEAMAAYDPLVVVPGHGHPAGLLAAQTQTLNYLLNLRGKIRAAIDAGDTIAEAATVDQSAFSKLKRFHPLAQRNARAVFTEMKSE